MGINFVSIRSFKNHSGKKYNCQTFPGQMREISADFRQFPKTSERCRGLLKMIYNLCLFVQQYCLTDQLKKELIQPVLAISSHELCKVKRVHKLTNVSKQSGHSESKVLFITASHHA